MRIPKVLLVLSGGKGTVEMVAESVKRCTPVVLVKESGGAAQAIAEFLAPLLPHKEQLLQNRPLLAERTASQYRAFAASSVVDAVRALSIAARCSALISAANKVSNSWCYSYLANYCASS